MLLRGHGRLLLAKYLTNLPVFDILIKISIDEKIHSIVKDFIWM